MTRLLYETIQFSPMLWEGDFDLDRQFAAANAAGLDGVGIDVWTLDRVLRGGGSLDEVRDSLERNGQRCVEFQALLVNGEGPEFARPPGIVEIVDALRPEIVMSGFQAPPSEADLDAFRRAVEQVTQYGATVALEFLPMNPIDTIEKALEVVHQVEGRIGVCVDTWHFFRGTDSWAELEALPASDLVYVQFNDALPLESDDLMMETLERRTLPGEGEFDLKRFCDVIRAKGYDGPVAIEIMSGSLRAEGPFEYARRVAEASRPFWE